MHAFLTTIAVIAGVVLLIAVVLKIIFWQQNR